MNTLIRIQQNQECFYAFSVSKGKYELIAYIYQQMQLIIVREGRKKDVMRYRSPEYLSWTTRIVSSCSRGVVSIRNFGGIKGIKDISGVGSILETLRKESHGSLLELAQQRLEVLTFSKLQYLH